MTPSDRIPSRSEAPQDCAPHAPEVRVTESVTTGPFSWFFTNANREMALPGHSHHALVTMEWRSRGPRGFPAFEGTYAAITAILRQLTRGAFRDSTNEEVARQLFAVFSRWNEVEARPLELQKWGGLYYLGMLCLDVRGTPDAIGHADGFTRYTVRCASAEIGELQLLTLRGERPTLEGE